ncbi:hypothetical protein PROFUN_08542 [Planoprotostelium fungivorum]|uniref:Uncharacterized protein n=1 Tax=Planoprotostelium fungivorum TaxID=1890364 RepID=A0A2P6N1M2_9EUKA|nr:hypothetical protein PROFUN_08542 [Planoprotostelium fungivorum]
MTLLTNTHWSRSAQSSPTTATNGPLKYSRSTNNNVKLSMQASKNNLITPLSTDRRADGQGGHVIAHLLGPTKTYSPVIEQLKESQSQKSVVESGESLEESNSKDEVYRLSRTIKQQSLNSGIEASRSRKIEVPSLTERALDDGGTLRKSGSQQIQSSRSNRIINSRTSETTLTTVASGGLHSSCEAQIKNEMVKRLKIEEMHRQTVRHFTSRENKLQGELDKMIGMLQERDQTIEALMGEGIKDHIKKMEETRGQDIIRAVTSIANISIMSPDEQPGSPDSVTTAMTTPIIDSDDEEVKPSTSTLRSKENRSATEGPAGYRPKLPRKNSDPGPNSNNWTSLLRSLERLDDREQTAISDYSTFTPPAEDPSTTGHQETKSELKQNGSMWRVADPEEVSTSNILSRNTFRPRINNILGTFKNRPKLAPSASSTVHTVSEFRRKLSSVDTSVMLLENLPLEPETGLPLFLYKVIGLFEANEEWMNCRHLIGVEASEAPHMREMALSGLLDPSCCTDPVALGNLLCQFLGELSDPVFPAACHTKLSVWTEIDEEEPKLNCLRSITGGLTLMQTRALDLTLNFLYNIGHSNPLDTPKQKKDNIRDLARRFGPLLLRAPNGRTIHSDLPFRCVHYILSSWQPQQKVLHQIRIKDAQSEQRLLRYSVRESSQFTEAATIQVLLDKTVDEFYSDPEMVEVILLTHRYFIQSTELLVHFVRIYSQWESTSSWKARLRLRSLGHIRFWLEEFSDGVREDGKFLECLKGFLRLVPTDSPDQQERRDIDFIKKQAQTIHNQRLADAKTLRRNLSIRALSEIRIDSADVQVLELDPKSLAEQITLIDWSLLKKISPYEFFHKSFDSPDRSPNFYKMVEKFNQWSMWVMSEILFNQKANVRAFIISHFIKTAEQCRKLGNFHGCYAIIAGLNYSAISRLVQTWEKVGRKYMVKYNRLCSLFEMTHNFKNYRDAIQAHGDKPMIPYLGLIPKDLTALEELPTFTSDNLVNFEKMRKLHRTLKVIRDAQQRQYNVPIEPELVTYLKHLSLLSKEEAFGLSLQREPKKNK